MAKGYWIAHVDVTNPDGYKAYVAANAEPLRKYGARFLVRGGNSETMEGNCRARHVVIEKGREGIHVPVRQGIIKCLNDSAPDWTAHLAIASERQ